MSGARENKTQPTTDEKPRPTKLLVTAMVVVNVALGLAFFQAPEPAAGEDDCSTQSEWCECWDCWPQPFCRICVEVPEPTEDGCRTHHDCMAR